MVGPGVSVCVCVCVIVFGRKQCQPLDTGQAWRGDPAERRATEKTEKEKEQA